MAANSATGVGNGDVDGLNKGSEHTSMSVSKLIGTRVMVSGVTTLSGGVFTVTFPTPLTGSHTKYSIFTQPYASTTVSRPTTRTDNSDGNFASFIITGGTTDVVYYMVVKN